MARDFYVYRDLTDDRAEREYLGPRLTYSNLPLIAIRQAFYGMASYNLVALSWYAGASAPSSINVWPHLSLAELRSPFINSFPRRCCLLSPALYILLLI